MQIIALCAIRRSNSLSKTLLVFDYFKETFHLNKQNKALYTPQIALIAVRVLLIVFAGIGVYTWIGVENINNLAAMQPREILGFILSQGLKVLALIIFYALVSVVIQAGLLNMYKKVVMQGYTEAGDFKEGVSKYFLKLLLGEIFIAICYTLALPFYLIIGLVTLSVGFTVIPMLAGIFLSMWKASLVMNDNGIFKSIGDSFGFAKRNFIPLTFLQIIHWAFLGGVSSRGGNFNFTENARNMPGNSLFEQPGVQQVLEQGIRIFRIAMAVLIPVVALATIGASIVLMIFEVFFSLALFVAYKKDFRVAGPSLEIAEPIEIKEIVQEAIPSTTDNIISNEINIDEYNAPNNKDNEEVEQ